MRLKLVCVRGYKRFGARACLDTRGPVVAIVGPNEAGKTSLLHAIEHVSSDDDLGLHEYTDHHLIPDEDWVVQADFSLEGDDRKELGDLIAPGLDLTYRHFRYPQGNAKFTLYPAVPRDKSSREVAVATLDAALADGWLESLQAKEDDEEGDEDEESGLAERGRELVEKLRSDDDWLPTEVRTELAELGKAIVAELPEELHDDSTVANELAGALEAAAAHENEQPPNHLINNILDKRVPQFLLFDDVARELQTEYVWGAHPGPPAALANLFTLANTDYEGFRDAAVADDRARLEALQEVANANLDEAFKAWRQADIHVAFSADHRSLQLLVRDRSTRLRTRLDERSAGLRSFVALIAFTARYGGDVRPVLLIDEAETHLHYGAQADLVRVFERQNVAETIIYTTHSIGCLPSDLGATLRVVSPVEGEHNRSTIHNSFWAAQRRAGLTPMMLAMGATALAFTPSRRAVIGEGPSEAILLPSLVREALAPAQQDEPLGYQVAPGVSEVNPDEAADLEMEAGGVAYLIDSDAGGRGHRRKLSERAKKEDRVVVLGEGNEEGLCIEDFLAPRVLVDAFNRLLERGDEAGEERVAAEDLPPVGRASYLGSWCRQRDVRLNKVSLAQEALDLGRQRGQLGDPGRKEQLRELHKRLLEATATTARADEA
jgi:predicted ATP-dependent endonuclease of OLD family